MIKLELDLSEVYKGFSQVQSRCRALGPYFSRMGRELRADQAEHAKAKAGPDGPWVKLADGTRSARRKARARLKAGGKRRPGSKSRPTARGILGRLPKAIRVRPSRSEVSVESTVAWSGVHQHGGKAGKGAKIPARPYLWMSEDFRNRAASELIKHAWKDWARRGG